MRLVGGLFRDRIDDPAAALAFWQGAIKAVGPDLEGRMRDRSGRHRAQRAAPGGAGQGTARFREGAAGPGGEPALTSRLNRVWGDWYSRKGDGPSARACLRAGHGRAWHSRKSAVEQDALARRPEPSRPRSSSATRPSTGPGPSSASGRRSTPDDKVEGYLTLLQARYWAARARWPQAIALAGDLVTVNPDSPYADRLTYLAAECEEQARAAPTGPAPRISRSWPIIPGSPLVGDARKKIGSLSGKKAGEQAVGRR